MGGYKGMRTRRDLKEKQPTVSIQPQNEQEEPVDAEDEMPNLDDPEVQAATAKIQAGYKGMQTRKELKEKKDLQQKDSGKEEEAEEMPNLEAPEVQAATMKIQAGYKGMKTRQDLKEKRAEVGSGSQQEQHDEEADEEEMPNLEDPEVQAATAKIQAGYKGMQTRKELKEKEEMEKKGDKKEEEEEEEMP